MINYLCFTFKYKCLCKDYSFYHLVNELAHMLARMMQKSGASKKNTLNQAPSLNACYQNPVINLKREKKNLVPQSYTVLIMYSLQPTHGNHFNLSCFQFCKDEFLIT